MYVRNGQQGELILVPRSKPPEGQGAIGIVMGNPTRSVSVIAALPTGVVAVARHGQELLAFPVRILRGQTSPEEGRLVGFKGMFDIYQEVRQSEPLPNIPSSVNVLGFFATISISLGILNLLPIPALDGGRIMFTLPEIVLGRRIPPRYENAINLVSFALLLMLADLYQSSGLSQSNSIALMENPQEIPFQTVLTALLDPDTPLNPRYLYRLSDLADDDLSLLKDNWEQLPLWRRQALMEDLEDLGAADDLLSFEAIGRQAPSSSVELRVPSRYTASVALVAHTT